MLQEYNSSDTLPILTIHWSNVLTLQEEDQTLVILNSCLIESLLDFNSFVF